MTRPRSRPSAPAIGAAFAVLAVVVIVASIGAGILLFEQPVQPGSSSDTGQAPGAAANGVRWRTEVVELVATALLIEANGLQFTGSPATHLNSDPGNAGYWTLEAEWREHGREQRLNLYFAADETAWWISEVRVYDGSPNQPDWAWFPGNPVARTPLGGTFTGELDLAGMSATGPVNLRLDGLRIAVHPQDTITEPIGGGIVLAENENPFEAGGKLYCSGILALPPPEAELRLLAMGYRLSWRWQYVTSRSAPGVTGWSEARAHAPDRGFISDAAVGSSGELIIFVEDPTRPLDRPAPALPPGCPSASP